MNIAKVAAVAALLLAFPAHAASQAAQPNASAPTAPAKVPPPQPLPPQLVLGQRLAAQAAAWTPISTVVIVADAVSYCQAIKAWTPTARFPVLIDDGSFESREDLARFVRGFRPKKVVRWTSPDAQGAGAETFAAADVTLAQSCIDASWGVVAPSAPTGTPPASPSPANLAAAWAARSHSPAGAVFISPSDPAWTAGVALAAGRGQPLLELSVRQQVDGYLGMAEAAKAAADVRAAVAALGLPFDQLGDTIDAVTLCVNAPIKFRPDSVATDMLALTDLVGRSNDTVNDNPRWAWCGMIHGTAAGAAYRAMSSLFIQPRSAWLFDGYPDSQGWKEFDATASGALLKKARFDVEVLDTPAQGARDWKARAARPIEGGLITVTTKGNSDFFDLEPGQCKPADVPIVTLPFAVHFTHSWSIERPGDRDTVGGRWLERGAFMYVGSVHEPFLHAFVPTPNFVGRLVSGAPFIASARHEVGPVGAKPWKIATLGDPLFSLLNRSDSNDVAIPLTGAIDIGGSLREDLQAGRFAESIITLTWLGRDADAATLAVKLRTDKPEAFRGPAASAAILPLFRTGQNREVLLAFALAEPKDQRNPALRDAANLAAHPFRESGADAQLAAALRLLTDAVPK